jgi:hypothetical protein
VPFWDNGHIVVDKREWDDEMAELDDFHAFAFILALHMLPVDDQCGVLELN